MIDGTRRLLEQESSKPRSSSRTLGRLLRYFRPFWQVLAGVVVMMGVSAWGQAVTPELLGQAVDCYLTPAAALSGQSGPSTQQQFSCWFGTVPAGSPLSAYLTGLGWLVAGLVGLFVLGSISSGLMFYWMSWAGQQILRSLQVEVFGHLHSLSLGFYSRNESGNLMSRLTNDVSTIQQAISFALVQVVSGALLMVWIGWNMLSLNWIYALLSLALVPVMVAVTIWFSNQARRAFRVTRKEIGNVNAELEESISGVREVQAFSREEANIEAFRTSNAANRDANLRAVAYTSALTPALEALGYVAVAVVAGVGGFFLLQGLPLGESSVTLGLIVAFIGYVQRFNQPISQIALLWANIQSAIAGAERIFDLLDEQPEIAEPVNARAMPVIAGRVVFESVWAEYTAGEPVLRQVDLVAEPGQTVAIVGPTGAGKTTLVNLLPRFYDVTAGRVTIDGIDVRTVQLTSLRRQIGMVLQDSFLFSDTVANNIRYARPDASDAEVVAAAQLARAHEFIERLPEGYATVLGERGGGLSQGQRQLLSIARAALANPRLLILDEATSSVDTRTERQIQAALESLLAGRTSFVIAHRLSTIRNADRVLVLVAGQIVEQGTHEELLALRGVYYNLSWSQFRRQEQLALP